MLCENFRVITNDIHLILQNYLTADSPIELIQQGYKTDVDLEEQNVGFTISLCNDNSAFIQNIEMKHKCTLYPPPSAQKIITLTHSINLNRVIVLLTNCSICVYKVNRETALLEKILQQNEIKDCEDKPINAQAISSMEILRMESTETIPPFDKEILNEFTHRASVN